MNQSNPSTAHEFDVICDCRTPDDEREAVTAVLQQADGIRSDSEGLLATLHHAISERASQIRDAEADYEDAQEAEEMIAWFTAETADLLTLLNLVLAVYPPHRLTPRWT